MWLKPLVFCFLPQPSTIRTKGVTKRLAVSIEPPPAQNEKDENTKPSAWDGISFVESDGNYLGESFLEEGPLYARQNDLPPLPVPSLQETIKRFHHLRPTFLN